MTTVRKMTMPRADTCDERFYGVVEAPGLYAIGLPFLRRRKSTFICGAEDDARDIVEHLSRYLAGP